MTDYASTTQTPPVEAGTKNSFQRIAGVLFAPVDTFRDIARRPDILVPLLVILIVSFAGSILTMNLVDWDAMIAQQSEQMKRQNPNMTDADIERMSGMTRAMGKVSAFVGPLVMIAWYAIVAGVLLLAFRLMGGEGTYKQAFSATLYAWMPLVLFGVIATIVIMARGSFDPTQMATLVKSNPAFLVDMKEQPVLFSLLSSLDVFTIWTVILLIVGFAALSKSSIGKSATIVVSLWIVMIV
ncbi:MAG TPA: Yip1 family protein, partial [Thermoanaerobaculia bacterium]|nr:Yip1 family protein [Thermoanaerobaculia bacterium]